jgi:gas vesicle protein
MSTKQTNNKRNNMSEENTSQRSGLTIFAVGALVGAGIALLYAPQSGKDTRKLLAKKAKALKDKAQDTVENAQEFINDRKAELVSAFGSEKQEGHDTKHKRS